MQPKCSNYSLTKTIGVVCTALLFVVVFWPGPSQAALEPDGIPSYDTHISAAAERKYSIDDTIVQTDKPDAVARYARTVGVTAERIGKKQNRSGVVALEPGPDTSIERIRKQFPDAVVGPNQLYQAATHFTPNDPRYGDQWNLDNIQAPEAWDTTRGSSDVTIAVIDTGVLFEQTVNGNTFTQPDFPSARRWENSDETKNGEDTDGNGYIDDVRGWDFMGGWRGDDGTCPNHDDSSEYESSENPNFVTQDNNPQPYSCDSPDHPTVLNKNHYDGSCIAFESACFVGHGTMVGSVAAAATDNGSLIAGIDHSANVMNLRVLDGYGFSTTDRIVEGIQYATEEGADVINLSLSIAGCDGEYSDPVVEDALASATDAGVTVVAASGNDGNDSVCYPASSPHTLAVGASTESDQKASFSNGGATLDVVAPGAGVPVANAPSDANPSKYVDSTNGTSLATPHVAGLAGLLQAYAPYLTTDKVHQLIRNEADKVPGMDGQNRTDSYGHGRINIVGSLDAVYKWEQISTSVFSDQAKTQGFTNKIALTPSETAYVRLKARNTGNETWEKSFLHLGTSQPRDRQSQFFDESWLWSNRVAELEENSVNSGNIGTLEFQLTAPGETGSYKECFNLVAEHRSWLNNQGLCYRIDVTNSINPAHSDTSVLSPGETLGIGDYLLSPERQSTFMLQQNGNLVLKQNFQSVWDSDTDGQSGHHLVMEESGNLVLYNKRNIALWMSHTRNNPDAKLRLQTDGNPVLYSASGSALWSAETVHNPVLTQYTERTLKGSRLYPGQQLQTPDRKFLLRLQRDGNLVLRNSNNDALWASDTAGQPSDHLRMQHDGNLVLRDIHGAAIWASNTAGEGTGSYVIMQEDRNVVVRDRHGNAVWASDTSR